MCVCEIKWGGRTLDKENSDTKLSVEGNGNNKDNTDSSFEYELS